MQEVCVGCLSGDCHGSTAVTSPWIDNARQPAEGAVLGTPVWLPRNQRVRPPCARRHHLD